MFENLSKCVDYILIVLADYQNMLDLHDVRLNSHRTQLNKLEDKIIKQDILIRKLLIKLKRFG